MDPLTIGIIGCVAMLAMLAIGVHIALALGFVGLVGTIAILGFDGAMALGTNLAYFTVARQTFIVVPLFVFMGLMAGAGGISSALYKVLSLWLGRVKGGMGVATVGSCTLFGVCTGSSLVTASVFSRISAPEMRRYGYEKKLAYGICASAGAIGMLIPPSVLAVIYGIIADLSVGKLLISGIVPGLLLAGAFSAVIVYIAFRDPARVGLAPAGAAIAGGSGAAAAVRSAGQDVAQTLVRVTWRERILSLRLIWPVMLVGLVMIVGMFGGIFSPTEAAAVGAFLILVIALVSAGSERWTVLQRGLMESVRVTSMVFFILIGAGLFARFLMYSGITPRFLQFVSDAGLSPMGFVLVIVVLYLILGCFMDSTSMIAITVPLAMPAVQAMHINPIWFALVSIMAIEVGLITPPVGLNVYAAKGVAEADVSLEDIFRGSMPFFFMFLLALAIMIALPDLVTWLPNLMIERQ